MSYSVEIVESSSNFIELEATIGDNPPTIEIIQNNSSEILVSHDIALLPNDFSYNIQTVLNNTIVGSSGISIDPLNSGIIKIYTTGLQPSGNYSTVGHRHTVSEVTDFNSAVSGLLPVQNVSAGSGISVSITDKDFQVSVTGQFGLTSEQVDDRVNDLLKSGSYIDLNYNDPNNTLTINVTGLQPSGDYSVVGHIHNIGDVTGLQSALDNKQISGSYAILVNGLIPASQLPSYVDDVLEYSSSGNFPSIGEPGKIYVTLDNNKTYRWGGSSYIEISSSPGSTDSVPEGSINKYYTDARASGAAPVQSVAGRIGIVTLTKNDVGLSNVNNTSDLNKPISLATQSGLDTKASLSHTHGNITNDGRIGSLSGQLVITTTSGLLTVVSGIPSSQITDFTSAVIATAPPTINANLLTTGILPDARLSSNVLLLNTNFGSAVSGLLPVKNITGSGYVNITNTSGIYNISVTGLQPSGNYAKNSDLGSLATKNYIKISDIVSDNLGGNYSDNGSADGFLAQLEANGLTDAIDSFGGIIDNLIICNSLSYQDQGGNIVSPQLSSILPDFDLFRYRSLLPSVIWQPNQDQYIYRRYTYNGRVYQKKSPDGNSGSVFNSGLYVLLGSAENINLSQVSGVGSLASLNNLGNISSSGNIGSVSGLLVTTGPSGLLTTSSGISSNYITNFNNSVSGLLPITNITGNSGIYISTIGTNFNISATGLAYTSGANFNSLSVSGIPVSVSGHYHNYTDIANFASGVQNNLTTTLLAGSFITINYDSVLDTLTISTSGLQPSGNYSTVGHSHIVSDITNFGSGVSGLLPVKNVSGSGYVNISNSNGTYTVSVTGLQPSGNYSLVGHGHLSNDITNFNSSVNSLVSGIYAPLNSPALTGIPTAPTASSGTNTNQIASTAFVRNEISNLVGSAPSTLDTLNELASALGNDANFSTTVTNSLAGKANLNGASFIGAITAPSGNFTTLQQNGIRVSVSGHSHISSDITNFNSSVSGLLPVKNIVGSEYANISNTSGTYTINITGVQPSGDYANSVHSHGNITNSGTIGSTSGVLLSTTSNGLISTISNSLTLGSTTVSIGGTYGSLSGLTSIVGNNINNPTVLTNCIIDGGSL